MAHVLSQVQSAYRLQQKQVLGQNGEKCNQKNMFSAHEVALPESARYELAVSAASTTWAPPPLLLLLDSLC